MDDGYARYGDLDTPAPRDDGRTAWDDYHHHRRAALDRSRIMALEGPWSLPPTAAPAAGPERPRPVG